MRATPGTYIIPQGPFELNHKVIGMLQKAILVILPEKAADNVCVVAIGPYTAIWQCIGQEVSGPVHRGLFTAGGTERGGRSLGQSVGRSEAEGLPPWRTLALLIGLVPRLRWWRGGCILPSHLWMTAKSVDKDHAGG